MKNYQPFLPKENDCDANSLMIALLKYKTQKLSSADSPEE